MTAEVVADLREHGVQAILLKGPTTASWLYGRDSLCTYVDTDLLVAPEQWDAAERCLVRLGFEKVLEDHDTPGYHPPAQEWRQPTGYGMVDLHRSLPGVGVDESSLWEEVSETAETTLVGGVEVDALSLAARALLIALHAAWHGPTTAKPLEDLTRALDRADRRVWEEAAALAQRLDATAGLSAGLRLHPAGERLAEKLGLPSDLPVGVGLLAGGGPPEALTLEALAKADGLRSKAWLVFRKVFPSRRFMRVWFPGAGHSRRRLAIAYLWRPIWLLTKAGPAWRSWRKARVKQAR